MRKGKKESWLPALAGFAAVLLMGGTGFYVYAAQAYRAVYFPNTVINGVDVSGRSPQEAKTIISSNVDSYVLNIETRSGNEKIDGKDIGLHVAFDDSMEQILEEQEPYKWIFHLGKSVSYPVDRAIEYDEKKLEEAVLNLKCMDTSAMTPPENAHLSEYISGKGYEIVPETEGTLLKREAVLRAAENAVSGLNPVLSLEDEDCYEGPDIFADDPSLVSERDARNRWVNLTVTYTFGDRKEILDGNTIKDRISCDGTGIVADETGISEYVSDLAKKYNTAYTTREFQTSYDRTVKVSGSYGWRINQQEETKELAAVLAAGESVEREPVYAQTAASHGPQDYGTTYVEVNLTAQHLFLYKDGKRILESDFVSGNVSRNFTTPPGLFSLTYKQKDAVLRGEGYASPVKFWMPFNGGIGFHDASWRSTFGGTIYKTNGSHGCVNLPYAAAKTLYENVYGGMPIICYNLEGTENKNSTSASGKAPAPAAAETSAPAPMPSTQPSPAETSAAQPAETTAAVTESSVIPAAPLQTNPSQGTVVPSGQTVSETSAAQTEGYGPGFVNQPSQTEVGPGV